MTENVGVLGTNTQSSGAVRVVNAPLPTIYGEFQAVGYLDQDRGEEQVALVYGDISGGEGILIRLHSECLTGDAFGSQHCECGEQLDSLAAGDSRRGSRAFSSICAATRAAVSACWRKLQAMKLQAEGMDTVEANLALGLPVDARDYRVAAEMLHDLGVRSVRLMSNNPRKREALLRHGIAVSEQVPLLITPCEDNITYLRTKRERLDHYLPHLDAVVHSS